LDWKSILAAGAEAGVETLVVENDEPAIPSLDAARISLDNLRRMVRDFGYGEV
jgi:sugar phosphate isomerase/epimerase